MSGNEIEARLAVAIANLESAKLTLLALFELTYPHMVSDQERYQWTTSLMLAENSLQHALREIDAVRKAPMLTPRSA